VSVTQATEVGTVYGVAELRAIGDACVSSGSRFTWTARVSPTPSRASARSRKKLTWQAGVDVLCFGGTKNGSHGGEAVVFFNRELAREFDYRCKQAGQLCSKMRFLAAPWVGMLEGGAWLSNAARANAMAQDSRRLCEHAGGEAALSGAGERGLRRAPTRRDRAASRERLAFLHVHRSRGLPAHVRVGYDGEDVDRFVADLRRLLAGEAPRSRRRRKRADDDCKFVVDGPVTIVVIVGFGRPWHSGGVRDAESGLLLASFFLAGCATAEVYEPEVTAGGGFAGAAGAFG
jgi:threonine aldolase